MTKEQLKTILAKIPSLNNLTEEFAKEQVYICLSCLNSWEDKGFEFNKKDFSFICLNCAKVVWAPKY